MSIFFLSSYLLSESITENVFTDLLKYLLEEQFAHNDKHTTTDIKEDM